MIKAVIFDLDGTLIDGSADLHAAINALFAEQGVASIEQRAVESFIGDGVGALVARSYHHAGVEPGNLAERIERFKLIYAAQGYPLTRLQPGVFAALLELSGRYQLALCTNKDEAHARAILAKCGIASAFGAVVGGDTLAVRKPDPRMLLHAAQGCGAAADEIVYVGDSEVDAALSVAAGATFLLYTEGHRSQPLEALDHAASFSDYAQLPALVRLADEGKLVDEARQG
jgi:phosphoglycolate phosphatase